MSILYNLEQNKNFLKFIDDDFKLEDKNISLYTTNFTEPLSYQASAFLKLPEFP